MPHIKKSMIALSILISAWVPNAVANSGTKAEILKQIQSPFNGELTVLDYSGSRYLLARAMRGIVLQSSMDLHRHQNLTMDYLNIMALVTGMHSKPRRIFNLGLGGGGLPRFQLQKCKKCSVDSVEVDPTVTQIATQYFDISNPRHRLIDGEGFDTLRRQAEKYDIIWVDAVLPKEGPKAYMKAMDLNTLRDHLQPDGLIIANLRETENPKYFSDVEMGYKRHYSHGIRIKIPGQDFSKTLAVLAPYTARNTKVPVKDLNPSYLIAVGNSSTLNCKHFWSLYRRWHKNRIVKVNWDVAKSTDLADYCQNLE